MQLLHRGIAWSLALVLGIASGANAGIVTYDGSVTSSQSDPNNHLYFGTASTNRGFTVYQSDPGSVPGLELGLRAHIRYPQGLDDPGSIKNQGNGTYGAFPAETLGPPGGASWNFDFSINTNFNNTGTTLALSGLHFVLSLDYDPAVVNTFSPFLLDPLALTDNGYGTNLSETADGTPATSAALQLATNVAQNSENYRFFAGLPAFNPNSPGLYDIALIALNANNEEVGRAQIEVAVATPEPASMAIWGLGALGCAFVGYRRKRAAA